jgi:hypothetical protein
MKALYEARIEDLGERDLVQIECLGCRHLRLYSAPMLWRWVVAGQCDPMT